MQLRCGTGLAVAITIIRTLAVHVHNGTGMAGGTVSPPGTTGGARSFFSEISGPTMYAYSYSWSQWIYPITVGTVMITENEATNQTYTTTVYHSKYEINGSTILLTRTDTNAAGTVTQTKTNYELNTTWTVAYPTPVFQPAEWMTWRAALPTMLSEASRGSCCEVRTTLSRAPPHAPFTTTGSTDARDPRGWLYTLVGYHSGNNNPIDWLTYPPDILSIWNTTAITIPYTGCSYTTCGYSFSASDGEGAGAVRSEAYLLATSTTTISSVAMSGDRPATALPMHRLSGSVKATTKVNVLGSNPTVPANISPPTMSTGSETDTSGAIINPTLSGVVAANGAGTKKSGLMSTANYLMGLITETISGALAFSMANRPGKSGSASAASNSSSFTGLSLGGSSLATSAVSTSSMPMGSSLGGSSLANSPTLAPAVSGGARLTLMVESTLLTLAMCVVIAL